MYCLTGMGEISRGCCPDPDWKLRLGLEEYLGASGSGWSCDLNCQDKKVEDFFSSIYPNFLYRNLRKLAPNIRKSRGQSWISPTLGSKIGKSWDCPQLFRTFLENSKSRDGLSRSIPTFRRIKDWPSRPNSDPSRPDFCQDFIPLKISCPNLLPITTLMSTLLNRGTAYIYLAL